MRVVIFGGSGMVGQGVLRECLRAADVTEVVTVGRYPIGTTHEKLKDVVHGDMTDFAKLKSTFKNADACFFCLGVSSAGMSEGEYAHITYDVTISAARVFASASPGSVFIYVSGAGTDSTEKGRSMWARVKGKTENALLAMPFKAAYMFRPGGIQPMNGIKSKTRSYRIGYTIAWPLLPLLRAVGAITTTQRLGLAMLECVRHGNAENIVGNGAINRLARSAVTARRLPSRP